MKKLLTIFVALLALGLFALPAMAGTDSAIVEVDVTSVANIDFDADTETEGDQEFLSATINSGNAGNTIIDLTTTGNLYWETNEPTYEIYAKFSVLWTEDGTGMEIEVRSGSWTALTTDNLEIRDPGVGTGDYDADVRLNGGEDTFWDVTPGDYDGTITFTFAV